MYFLVILRYLLGWLPRTPAVAKPASIFRESGTDQPWAMRAVLRSAMPHEWMCVDDALTESPGGLVCYELGTFERANDPLRSIFWFARRLAWGPEAYLVLAAKVSVNDRRPRRA
jgi:hypothetical protein